MENKICGATDIALTELGHSQAIETGKVILDKGIRFDEILSSPLVRASETARHISEITGVPMRIEPRLICAKHFLRTSLDEVRRLVLAMRRQAV